MDDRKIEMNPNDAQRGISVFISFCCHQFSCHSACAAIGGNFPIIKVSGPDFTRKRSSKPSAKEGRWSRFRVAKMAGLGMRALPGRDSLRLSASEIFGSKK